MLVGPLALTSANRGGGAEAVNAREVLDVLGSDLDLVIDDGPCRFGEPSSVVRIHGNRYEVLARAWFRKRPCSGFPAR